MTEPGTVTVSTAGTRQDRNRVRNRILHPAITEANKLLAKRKLAPLPEGLTVYSLRHTFVSVLLALGKDLPMSWSRPGMTTRARRFASTRRSCAPASPTASGCASWWRAAIWH